MQEITIVMLAIVGFAIGFPLFWMAIIMLISRIGGWSELTKRFGSDAPAKGEVFTWCSARLRALCNYSNCLRVTVSDAGIHIRTLIFFKMGHRPLFIPWRAVQDLKVRRYWRYSSGTLAITDESPDWSATIVLYGWGLAERLKEGFDNTRSA
ncbi:MAG: hypothetical protein AAGF86_07575 [Pseudomonadota bacterium]